jgi:hypothetical protein
VTEVVGALEHHSLQSLTLRATALPGHGTVPVPSRKDSELNLVIAAPGDFDLEEWSLTVDG